MQPVTCNVVPPTSIVFEKQSYTAYARYESVSIAPVVAEFTSCTINPQPSEGLSFDATTCTLSGKSMTQQSAISYTVTSTINGQQYTGSFQLQFTDCSGTVATILRTYKTSAANEAFTIKDSTTQQVVLQVNTNSGQVNSQDWSSILCLTGSKYEITTSSTLVY